MLSYLSTIGRVQYFGRHNLRCCRKIRITVRLSTHGTAALRPLAFSGHDIYRSQVLPNIPTETNSVFARSRPLLLNTHTCRPLRTRLTIVANNPEGFEFTIRTPGTPTRWAQYEDELCAVWGKLTAAVCESPDREDGETETEEAREDAVCDLILTMFYYWVNFGPLSRGSAACGYIVLSGLMAAAGWRLTELLPPNVQMDWEAILRPSPEAFIAKARPWLRLTRRREDILEGVPAVHAAFPTALEAIKALNGA